MPRLKIEPRTLWVVLAATVVGALPRLSFALGASFPLNDGGLFYTMIRDLRAAGYALPALTTYNAAGIPFAYPPLGLYAAGLLSDWFRWPLLDVMRLLPPLVSVATVPVYYALARCLTQRAGTAFLATFAFALLPVGFDWMVMGGGVTRSFGLLFALLTLQQTQQLLARPHWLTVVTTGLCAGLTALSHLGLAWFAAYSVGVLFVCGQPNRRGLLRLFLALGVAGLVCAPWLATLLLRAGAAQFLAAWQSSGLTWWSLVTPLFFLFTNEPLIDLAAVFGLLGLLCCVRDRRPLLPLWLGVIFLLQTRATPAVAIIPFGLLVGLGLNELVLPALGQLGPRPAGERAHASPAIALLLVYLLVAEGVSAYLNAPKQALPAEQRAAMAWVAANTPAGSRFAVLTNTAGWEGDMVSEWFPALTRRVSLATPQGMEWLPGDRFQQQRGFYAALQVCAAQGLACLQPLLPSDEAGPVYVYFSLEAGAAEPPLLVALAGSSAYPVVYAEPQVQIFRVP